MTKFTCILSTLILLAITVSAAPGGVDAIYKRTVSQGVSPNLNASPNVAQAKNYHATLIEARQYHNADYGAGGGPSGNPQPTDTNSSMPSSTIQTQQAAAHTVDGTQQYSQNERRAVPNSIVPRATPVGKHSHN